MRTPSGPDLRLVAAAAAVVLAVWPGLVPHPGWVTAVVGGVLAGQAWAVAAGVRALVRAVSTGRSVPSAPVGRIDRLRAGLPGTVLWAVSVGGLGTGFVAAHRADVRLARSVGVAPPSALDHVVAVAGAGLLTAVLVTLPATVPVAVRLARRSGARLRGRRAWRVGIRVGAGSLVLVVGAALVPSNAIGAAAAGTGPDDVRVALSTDPSSWHLSRFVVPSGAAARTPPGLGGLGGPADRLARTAPLRVFGSLGSGPDAVTRARRAVAAFELRGGLDRRVVLVAVPTGSGWVNRAAPDALERLLGGDVGTLAVQYSDAPSWVAFLRGGDGSDEAVLAVLAELADRVAARPPGRRPTVLAWGESLGAWAGLRATAGSALVAGMLWVGVPRSAPRPAPQVAARTVLLNHRDDPVAHWGPDLLLPFSRGDNWLPLASFWRSSADVVASLGVPAGHGHRFGAEYDPAWRLLLARIALPLRSY